jgi:hypothetical protein
MRRNTKRAERLGSARHPRRRRVIQFTFAELARTIRDRGGHYSLFVKGNRRELHAELAHSFGEDFPLKARQPAGPEPTARRSA